LMVHRCSLYNHISYRENGMYSSVDRRGPLLSLLFSSLAELPRSSAVRLSSLRDLPAQLQEQYQQGFTLVALHPFVQPTDEREKTPQEQIFRAVLIKKTERWRMIDFELEGTWDLRGQRI
uniref:Raftlin, lipid raft linker 1 n=1 Tax=Vombatus ursinus TaxID=29139 RepID=A0A4X2JTY2_VOMUR